MFKRAIAIVITAALILSFSACSSKEPENNSSVTERATQVTTQAPTEVQEYKPVKSDKTLNEQGLADNIGDGAILHAWCWSFNTIKENMEDIANSGFSTIQTSPINLCKVGEGGGMQLQDSDDSINNGKWYYHYQPVDYTIGNYQLGTEEEFKAMCDEADKYGIKIIVDAVVNHMTSDRAAISDNVNNLSDPFHKNGDVADYSDRKEVTQGNLLGLVDLNTQNEEVQQYVLNYLKKCVELGADGFRYDGAKHIELSDDDESYAGEFWDVVLDNGSKFQYGEILQGGSDRISSYSKKMNVTASKYGDNVRSALLNTNITTNLLTDFYVANTDADSLVTWVESHDNYCNDGSWSLFDEAAIKRGWAIITAREGGTPLFFSRPMGASVTDQWGNNEIGKAGSDFYKDPEVVEINKFRNQMIGEEENLSNPMEDTSIMMIERGNRGVVLVSVSLEDVKLQDVKTTLSDGDYKDKISGEKFTVKNGNLNGTLKAEQIVVLYK